MSLPKPFSGHAALRRGRYSACGQIYLVTFTTHDRRCLFLDDELARAAVASILDARNWSRARLLAWVLMPNHWHGVVELEDDSLASVVRKVKANSARVVRSNSPGTISKVWADAFHDHALREDEGLVDMARYVVLNPVRAGLVRRIRDYPYWDAIWK